MLFKNTSMLYVIFCGGLIMGQASKMPHFVVHKYDNLTISSGHIIISRKNCVRCNSHTMASVTFVLLVLMVERAHVTIVTVLEVKHTHRGANLELIGGQ